MSRCVSSATFAGQGLIGADWQAASNWSGGVVPGAGTTALIAAADVLVDPFTALSAVITLVGGSELVGNGSGFAFTPTAYLQADDNNALYANGAIVNEGIISAAGPGTVLTIVVQAGSYIAALYGLTEPSFANTGNVVVADQATLNITGTELSNTGTINLQDAGLNLAGGWVDGGQGATIPGGTIELGQGAIANFADGVTDQTFLFTGPGTITLSDPHDVAQVAIADFGYRDEIITRSVAQANSLLAGGLIFTTPLPTNEILTVQATSLGAVISLASSIRPVTSDNPPCFARGARLLTASGYVPVEHIQPGDMLVTVQGVARPVRWVGWRTIDLANHPAPSTVQPVTILAGALADGVPGRDLTLSPDHGLFLHGKLVPVKLLVNGATIRRAPGRLAVTYFHFELDEHSIIIAENLPVETYLDTGNRAAFANSSGKAWAVPVLGRGRQWDVRAVADLCLNGPALRAIRAEIFARTVKCGYSRRHATALSLHHEGGLVAQTSGGVAAPGFRLPARHGGTFLIRSETYIPAEISDGSAPEDDYRRLGIAVRRIKLGLRAVLPQLLAGSGWHGSSAGDSALWTTGEASINVPLDVKFLGMNIQGFPMKWVQP